MDSRIAPAPSPASQDTDATPVVVFEHVAFAYDQNEVLRDVSFTVPRGSMRIFLGASGAGKSTVLKLILGLLRPDAGTIHVNGHRVDTMSERDLLRVRADIGMAFQENALFDSLTVAENVGYRLYERGDSGEDEVRQRVMDLLRLVGLEEFIDRMPAQLSGGQRRRVAIARALAAGPSLVLFDDPTTGLDPIIATSVDDTIIRLRDARQVTSLFVTQQIRDAIYIATHRAVRGNGGLEIAEADETQVHARFLVLHEGRVYFEGSAAELLGTQDPFLQRFSYMSLPPW